MGTIRGIPFATCVIFVIVVVVLLVGSLFSPQETEATITGCRWDIKINADGKNYEAKGENLPVLQPGGVQNYYDWKVEEYKVVFTDDEGHEYLWDRPSAEALEMVCSLGDRYQISYNYDSVLAASRIE